MQAEVRTGPVVSADGSIQPARGGKTGEIIVADAHARFHEATVRGAVYSGSIVGQVTTVGLATTYTGLCLSNPVGSGKVVSIISVGYAFIVAFAAGSVIGLMTGYNAATNVTHTTPVTVRSNLYTGGGGNVALLDSAATLPTAPTLNEILGAGLTGAITTSVFIPSGAIPIDGRIALPPGGYAAFYTSTASGAAAGAFSFTWEEVSL